MLNSVNMSREEFQHLTWVKMYEQTGDAGLTCRRCGISRPTLRKWLNRYVKDGKAGLSSHSRKPHISPNTKVSIKEERLILALRLGRKLGARRLQSELKRLHEITLSLATIHKVLVKNGCKPLLRYRKKADYIRYFRLLPGDRVQMDTCKIGLKLYQYTAIDDCTRYRVLRLYNARNAANTLDFIDAVIEEMYFPIQRIQTDRGTEFFAEKVQKRLKQYNIKFRPNKPASPHLNGKVERSQKTDREEFYPTIDLKNETLESLNLLLAEWQHYYNWYRPHSAHGSKSPMERYHELSKETPFWDEIIEKYQPAEERIQMQNYRDDFKLRKLKRSL